MVHLFHDNKNGQVRYSTMVTTRIQSPSEMDRVKQGYVLAPVLLSLFFTQVILHTGQNLDDGIFTRYRFDGSLISVPTPRLWRHYSTWSFVCRWLCSHGTQESHLQTIVDSSAETSRLFGLTISLSRAEVLFQAFPLKLPQQPTITFDGSQLTCVKNFKHLGSIIQQVAHCRTMRSCPEFRENIQALGWLRVKVLKQKRSLPMHQNKDL